MTKKLLISACFAFPAAGLADDLTGIDKYLCSPAQILVCFEGTECTSLLPWEADVPQFVIIDTKKKIISTTKGSAENRSTPIQSVHREGATVYLQGVEGGRAFSFVIEETSGLLSATVTRDGLTVSIFGSCTDPDV